jgi:SAM-dependent methyltransferase
MFNNLATAVNRTLSPDDVMYCGNAEHYFSCGESALRVLLAAMSLANITRPSSILDFGAGAGRVTRWIKAAFPDSRIHGCDIRGQDMEFLRSSLGVETSTVGTNIDLLTVPGRYDVIWAGSVITHLPAARSRDLLAKLLTFCNPGGLLAASFHGRYAIERQESGALYIHDEAWQQIKSDYVNDGYGYADYEGQPEYGISVCNPLWIIRLVQSMGSARLVLLGERVWDDHHDVVVIQDSALGNRESAAPHADIC